ncbi:MAG: hypothetical protein KAI66_12735 [Lentisphaeria bacterium]|nr:hypothetical protein [Lentisphaeria bacterium]
MPSVDFHTSLEVLDLLADALTVPHTLDEGLDRITRMTCELMSASQTVVLFRDEELHQLIVRTSYGIDSPSVRVGHPIVVPDRLKDLIWRQRYTHQLNSLDAGIEGIEFPIMVTALCVKGERIGVLLTSKSTIEGENFQRIRRRIFTLIANFASLVIENAKVYDYLRQQFAQRSQELIVANRKDADTRDEIQQLMISSLNNPNKVVRLLAESFYKELARAGFSAGHITTATAHILECIVKDDDHK